MSFLAPHQQTTNKIKMWLENWNLQVPLSDVIMVWFKDWISTTIFSNFDVLLMMTLRSCVSSCSIRNNMFCNSIAVFWVSSISKQTKQIIRTQAFSALFLTLYFFVVSLENFCLISLSPVCYESHNFPAAKVNVLPWNTIRADICARNFRTWKTRLSPRFGLNWVLRDFDIKQKIRKF